MENQIPVSQYEEEVAGMVVCPGCGVEYWSEDGHPDGTLCPWIEGEEEPRPADARAHYPPCPKCKTNAAVSSGIRPAGWPPQWYCWRCCTPF